MAVINNYQMRNSRGEIEYQVGFSGGTDRAEDDISNRKPKNSAEAACFDILEKHGWKPTKRGWPDYFCVRNNEICMVEVKPHKRNRLRRNQLALMGLLAERGIKCFMWSPDGGFEEVKPKTL